jgi:hypothetical protein
MLEAVCPKCSSDYVKRVSRIGPERLISLFYIYPLGANPAGTDSDSCNGVSRIGRRNGLISREAEREPGRHFDTNRDGRTVLLELLV